MWESSKGSVEDGSDMTSSVVVDMDGVDGTTFLLRFPLSSFSMRSGFNFLYHEPQEKEGFPPSLFSQFEFSIVSWGFLYFLSVSLGFTTTRPHRNRSDGLLRLPVCTSSGPRVLEGTLP